MKKKIFGIIGVLVVLFALSATATAAPFVTGDIFASVGNGLVKHYTSAGVLVEILDTGKGPWSYTTGSTFDKNNNLYVTDFSAGTVSKFDALGILVGNFGSGYSGSPESIVFDASGNAYVGAVNGDNDIRKFDASGTPLAQYNVDIEDRGSDWIDLAADQKTIFYTSEGYLIKRYDVSTSTQLADFATLPSKPCYALRIRPNGDVMVACTNNAYRVDSTGALAQTYSVGNAGGLFALNLDPDGTHFWTGSTYTNKLYKVDITTGAIDQTIDTAADSGIQLLGGVSKLGEIKVGCGNNCDGNGGSIPEFPTVALPIMSVLGIMFLMSRKKPN
jgi:sugar lactone lactonase YvrE